jgi:hypothetical protein
MISNKSASSNMWPTIVIARQIATRRVKADLAAQGIKLREVKALDIKRWAEAYLNQHPELVTEADDVIEACPELKKIAERERRRLRNLGVQKTALQRSTNTPALSTPLATQHHVYRNRPLSE